jgi:Fe-S-cluster containining protein
MHETIRKHVGAAVARTEVRDAVARVYAELQGEIDARRPICSASGRCCRFEEYGHRLYVTTLELAAFVAGLENVKDEGAGLKEEQGRGPRSLSSFILQPSSLPWDGSGCPFQVAKLCSVHAIRPFGCRMFFCDPTSTRWQNERYEQFHAELKRLHEQLNVPYLYVEWRQALAALGLTPASASGDLSRT